MLFIYAGEVNYVIAMYVCGDNRSNLVVMCMLCARCSLFGKFPRACTPYRTSTVYYRYSAVAIVL